MTRLGRRGPTRDRTTFPAPMTFSGSVQDLKAVVTLLHLQGHWSDEGDLRIFSTASGEHINFWPASGELQVQGHPQASQELEARLEQAMAHQAG